MEIEVRPERNDGTRHKRKKLNQAKHPIKTREGKECTKRNAGGKGHLGLRLAGLVGIVFHSVHGGLIPTRNPWPLLALVHATPALLLRKSIGRGEYSRRFRLRVHALYDRYPRYTTEGRSANTLHLANIAITKQSVRFAHASAPYTPTEKQHTSEIGSRAALAMNATGLARSCSAKTADSCATHLILSSFFCWTILGW